MTGNSSAGSELKCLRTSAYIFRRPDAVAPGMDANRASSATNSVTRLLKWYAAREASRPLNPADTGVSVEFQRGNASQMPFADASFDFVVCMAAFKNFSDPIGALNEIHRVLKPGGQASILDLRKDASPDEIAREVRHMNLSKIDSLVTHWTFRFVLLKRAYTCAALEAMVVESRFRTCEIGSDGIGFELRLTRQRQILTQTSPAVTAA